MPPDSHAGIEAVSSNPVKLLSTVVKARAANVSVTLEPATFYDSVVKGIYNAQKRLSIATLYWGEGAKEMELVGHLRHALAASSQLEATLVVDGSRAKRWNNPAFAEVKKLATEYPDRVNIGYFKPEGVIEWFPSFWNEILSVFHGKFLISDDDVIITGANLSTNYFTTRQDRALLFKDSTELANLLCQTNDVLLEHSKHPAPGALRNQLSKRFVDEITATDFTALKDRLFSQSIPSVEQADGEDCVYILPVLQYRPINFSAEETMLPKLLEQCPTDYEQLLTTAYFNPRPEMLKALQDSRQSNRKILLPDQDCHGFAGGRNFKGTVPGLHETCIQLAGLGGVQRYTRPGWTYHAKGYWAWKPSGNAPTITYLCSSNMNYRSWRSDFELGFLMWTRSAGLSQQLREEAQSLLQYSRPSEQSDPALMWRVYRSMTNPML